MQFLILLTYAVDTFRSKLFPNTSKVCTFDADFDHRSASAIKMTKTNR